MKKRISLLQALVFAAGLIPALPVTASAGSIPSA